MLPFPDYNWFFCRNWPGLALNTDRVLFFQARTLLTTTGFLNLLQLWIWASKYIWWFLISHDRYLFRFCSVNTIEITILTAFSGELKAELISVLTPMVLEHQVRFHLP